MNRQQAYALFERMIAEAESTLHDFTLHSKLSIEHKADKSAVTACDEMIDKKLSALAHEAGLQVVSEEGEKVLDIVKSGNYITIDPIDGTLGYIEYVNHALEHGGIESFLKEDLGAKSDFCLLLGIVEHGVPTFGACYNYITHEKILIDGSDKSGLIHERNARNYTEKNAIYLDQRFLDDPITKELLAMPDVSPITQATVGLKTLYTILNPHQNAVTVHRVQVAGLWDIMPTAVAARAFGGEIYDDTGAPLKLNEYILLPGKGVTVVKGEMFGWVREKLM